MTRMFGVNVDWTVEVDAVLSDREDNVDVVYFVTGRYTPSQPGTRTDPPEPAEVTITGIRAVDVGGEPFDVMLGPTAALFSDEDFLARVKEIVEETT